LYEVLSHLVTMAASSSSQYSSTIWWATRYLRIGVFAAPCVEQLSPAAVCSS
jgi:hypothetical protein